MAITDGNDFVLLQPTDGTIVGAGQGNDTYIVSPSLIGENQQVTISDVSGDNILQLVNGLSIASSQVTADALLLTLSNGAVVKILGADNFTFDVGGNTVGGVTGVQKGFTAFVEEELGTTVPAEGAEPTSGGPVEIGGTAGEFTLTADADSVNEGATATFSVENGEANFTYSYEITGVDPEDVDGPLTGVVTTDENGNASIEVALVADRSTDGEDNLTVSLTNTGKTATTTVNDTSLSNVAPVAEDVAIEVAEAGDPVSGEINATDAEGDALTIALDADVPGLTLNEDGTFVFDPSANPDAQALVYTDDPLVLNPTFTVTDALGATDQKTLTITVTPTPLTFELGTAVNSVEESVTQIFTVTASEAVAADTDVTFTLLPGDGTAINAGTNTTNTSDFDTGAFNPKTVTIAAGQTTAEFEVVPSSDATTELPETFTVEAEVEGVGALTPLTGTVVDATTAGAAGQTFTLTTGVDLIPGLIGSENSAGTDGDDTIIGVLDTTDATLSSLDSIDGGLGENTLRIDDIAGGQLIPGSATFSNIQIVNLRADGDVGTAADFFDTTDIGGATEFNVTVGEDVYVKAADSTAINVSGARGGDGGAGEAEEFTATFSLNGSTDADTITFDGITVTMAGTEADKTAVATKFAADYNTAGTGTYTAVDNTDGTVTFTAKNTGDIAPNVTAAGFVVVDAGDTNAVDVDTVTIGNEGVDGGAAVISADGGSTQNLTAEKADYDVTSNNAAGAVTVTHEEQGLGAITVNDGTDVTVTSTSTTSTGSIAVGGGDAPTGAVTITQNLDSEGDDLTGGAITTTGGTSVDVTVNGTITADEFTDNGNTLTAGAITVNGNDDTTTVTVLQNLTDNDSDKTLTSAATKESVVVTFGALKEGEAVVIGDDDNDDGTNDDIVVGTDLTFVASKNLTAEEVAQAFANLTEADIQANGGIVENGYFLGSLIDATGNPNTADWVSGPADGATVTFEASDAGAFTDGLVVAADADATAGAAGNNATNAADFSVEVTAGKNEVVDEDAADVNVTAGGVVVDDSTGSAMTSITLGGYGASSDIVSAGSLETLFLANSAQALTVDAAVEELTVNLDGITGGANLDLDDQGGAHNETLKTLNLGLSGTNSEADIIADVATALNVSGSASLDMTDGGSDIALVEDVTVTGAASLILDGIDTDVLQTIDASGTTGGVTASMDTDNASATEIAFQGGSGADELTLVTDADVAGDIQLGNGNDTLILTASTTGIAGDVDAGDGDEDTISMDTTSAENLDADELNATGFERLVLTSAATTDDIDVETLGFNYVTVAGVNDTAADDTFTVRMATGGTVVVSAKVGDGVADANDTDTVVIDVTDADTNGADIFNLGLDGAGDIDADTVQINDVETINIDSTDSTATNTVILSADSATTINLEGAADTTLGLVSTSVELVDASTLSGGLTLVANGDNGTTGMTVQGGTVADILTASGENDVLIGNGGNDTFNAFELTDVNGGEGMDTFNFFASSNLAKVSTVIDDQLDSGDVFNLFIDDDDGTLDVTSGTNGDGAFDGGTNDVIVDKFYADGAQYNENIATTVELRIDAAVQQTSEGEATWFNFGNFTYIVIDADDPAAGDDVYSEGADTIIEITGVYDLSTDATFNATNGTLEIV